MWSVCDRTCGAGVRTRSRACFQDGGCAGSSYDRQPCEVPCSGELLDIEDISALIILHVAYLSVDFCIVGYAYCTLPQLMASGEIGKNPVIARSRVVEGILIDTDTAIIRRRSVEGAIALASVC